jgi:hypothetical protein
MHKYLFLYICLFIYIRRVIRCMISTLLHLLIHTSSLFLYKTSIMIFFPVYPRDRIISYNSYYYILIAYNSFMCRDIRCIISTLRLLLIHIDNLLLYLLVCIILSHQIGLKEWTKRLCKCMYMSISI